MTKKAHPSEDVYKKFNGCCPLRIIIIRARCSRTDLARLSLFSQCNCKITRTSTGARFNCIKKHHETHHENHHEKTSHQKVTIKKSNWTFVMSFVMIFVMIFFQLNWAPDQSHDNSPLYKREKESTVHIEAYISLHSTWGDQSQNPWSLHF